MASIRIPAPLRPYTEGKTEVPVEGLSVREAMASLIRKHPALEPHLYDGHADLRPFVNVFVGEHNIRDLQGLETRLQPDARLMLVPSIAGGAHRGHSNRDGSRGAA